MPLGILFGMPRGIPAEVPLGYLRLPPGVPVRMHLGSLWETLRECILGMPRVTARDTEWEPFEQCLWEYLSECL